MRYKRTPASALTLPSTMFLKVGQKEFFGGKGRRRTVVDGIMHWARDDGPNADPDAEAELEPEL